MMSKHKMLSKQAEAKFDQGWRKDSSRCENCRHFTQRLVYEGFADDLISTAIYDAK